MNLFRRAVFRKLRRIRFNSVTQLNVFLDLFLKSINRRIRLLRNCERRSPHQRTHEYQEADVTFPLHTIAGESKENAESDPRSNPRKSAVNVCSEVRLLYELRAIAAGFR